MAMASVFSNCGTAMGFRNEYTLREVFHRAAFGLEAASEHTTRESHGGFKDAWAEVEARTKQER